jgi:hypothetical protein
MKLLRTLCAAAAMATFTVASTSGFAALAPTGSTEAARPAVHHAAGKPAPGEREFKVAPTCNSCWFFG